ncbi:sensor histidine kinase [Microbulbifer rhizosphaerae]|uniref:Signal transduction histidine kinase n=1 Tax=Microbulbifer rhizosphaerae TaxID=1562603 RepID=A0A7W4WEY2_9GAMM|nr:hypothetical protein [Microbulbifer rhizosphaerae]MBB3062408.1 signal transduction histidine kinase [Microbulbifer rhizosphaerae]
MKAISSKESLTKVARHADASKVEIKMTTKDQHLTLQIHDNGKGFHVDDNKGTSYGLAGLPERAIMLGG